MRHDLLGVPHRCKNGGLAWDAPMEGAAGGGIFALRRSRPYRRHGGESDATLTIIYAHAEINRNGSEAYNDASRRYVLREIGRISFRPPYSKRETAAKGA